MRFLSAALLILCLCLACAAQGGQTTPETPEQKFDKLLGRHVSPASEGCQQRLDEWSAWAKTDRELYSELNDKYDQLYAENQRLRNSAEEVRMRIFVAFLAVGFGLFMAWGAIKAIRRCWPISKQRRQLVTLLIMAAWVSVASAVAANEPRLAYHPINLTLSVFVYSLPALTFGGIGVWWFGRTKSEILF